MAKKTERPWADLSPDLLNIIYEKLPPSAAARSSGFGSVCKPWREFHAAVPLPPPREQYSHRPGHPLRRNTLTRLDAAIPIKIRNQLYASSVAYVWLSNEWLLLRHSLDGRIFCCFNPLLSWPQNYIKLPTRYAVTPTPVVGPTSPPIMAAFSSDPTGQDDWTILVIGARPGTFSTFRRGDRAWKNYIYWLYCNSDDASRYQTHCVAIGFHEGKFLCLLESGDVLISGIGGCGERRMLHAYRLPASGRLTHLYNSLINMEIGGGEEAGAWCAVVSWERVGERDGGGERSWWRLAGVESRRKEEAERVVVESMEEGRGLNSGVVLVREHPKHQIYRPWQVALFNGFCVLCIIGFMAYIISIPIIATPN